MHQTDKKDVETQQKHQADEYVSDERGGTCYVICQKK